MQSGFRGKFQQVLHVFLGTTFAKHRVARDQHFYASSHYVRNGLWPDSAIHFDPEICTACRPHGGQLARLIKRGGDELLGQVWNTGGWESLSQWLRLGRLRVPAGRSRLIVRAIEKDTHTVMNLFGVRLVPMESTA